MENFLNSLGYIPRLSLLFLCIGALSSCMNVATTSMQAVYNRHGLQENLHDHYVTMRTFQALQKDQALKSANIAVATYHGEVLLVGQAPTQAQKEKAFDIAKRVSGADTIYNHVTIGNPTGSLIKMSDSWLTTKVKSKLIASNDIDATQIKVVSENGVVYLMGVIKANEADEAIALARETQGAQQVVDMFSYVTISKNKLA